MKAYLDLPIYPNQWASVCPWRECCCNQTMKRLYTVNKFHVCWIVFTLLSPKTGTMLGTVWRLYINPHPCPPPKKKNLKHVIYKRWLLHQPNISHILKLSFTFWFSCWIEWGKFHEVPCRKNGWTRSTCQWFSCSDSEAATEKSVLKKWYTWTEKYGGPVLDGKIQLYDWVPPGIVFYICTLLNNWNVTPHEA